VRRRFDRPFSVPHQEVLAMADLVPHPLVTGVGLDLAEKNFGTLRTEAKNLVAALTGKKRPDQTAFSDAASGDAGADTDHVAEKNQLATALADQANLPDLSLFAGFLGGPYTHDNVTWRLFYFDSLLSNWLFIPENDIVLHQRLDDDHAPSGKRDALWVRGSATVVRGSGSRANAGRFLVGEFTRAGDFAASTTGGTFSAASGLLCEATTPGCCWGARSR
jgi:hypothetical protein